MFWNMLFALCIVAVIMTFITEIVKLSLRHAENIKRIEHGYPTLDGSKSSKIQIDEERDIVDLTERLQ